MGKMKKFGDVFGSEEFYPDAEKIDVKDIVDIEIILRDCKILEDFKGEYGTHDAALIMFSKPSDDDPQSAGAYDETEYTSICSGVVFVDQIKKVLKRKNSLPIEATIIMKSSGKNQYYMLT